MGTFTGRGEGVIDFADNPYLQHCITDLAIRQGEVVYQCSCFSYFAFFRKTKKKLFRWCRIEVVSM